MYVRSRIDRNGNPDNLYDRTLKVFFWSEAIEYIIRRNIQIPPRRIFLCSLCSGRKRTTEYVEAS